MHRSLWRCHAFFFPQHERFKRDSTHDTVPSHGRRSCVERFPVPSVYRGCKFSESLGFPNARAGARARARSPVSSISPGHCAHGVSRRIFSIFPRTQPTVLIFSEIKRIRRTRAPGAPFASRRGTRRIHVASRSLCTQFPMRAPARTREQPCARACIRSRALNKQFSR